MKRKSTRKNKRRVRKEYSKRNISRKKGGGGKKGGSDSKRITKIALLIPIYPKDYEHIYRILNKLKDNDIHINVYCIFSNKEEYELFSMKDSITNIIAENVPNDKSVIQYKKLYGLKHMIDTPYEYIISCDSETDIIPENFTEENILSKVKDIFEQKKIYGINSPNPDFKDIMNACANVFTGEEKARITSATRDLKLYTFWYNVPVYRREDISGFLEKIKFGTLQLTFYTFDALMYDYYLIATQQFEVIDLSYYAYDVGHGLYVDNIENVKKIKELGFGFGSVLGKQWRDKKDILQEQKVFLLINTDREY
jgi:hypothetical protein